MQHEDAAKPPVDFLCPINQALMVEPAMLVETGHSYETAEIRRWLDTHDTCPISRQKLRSKQLVPNLSLKRAIADWAASHGVSMPAAPTYISMHHSIGSQAPAGGFGSDVAAAADQRTAQRSAGSKALTAAAAGKGGLSARSGELGRHESDSESPIVVNMPGALANTGAGGGRRGGAIRCTRTRWALALVALLLVAAGIAAGVGIYFTLGRNKQGELGTRFQWSAACFTSHD
jgi:hypothetical protein